VSLGRIAPPRKPGAATHSIPGFDTEIMIEAEDQSAKRATGSFVYPAASGARATELRRLIRFFQTRIDKHESTGGAFAT
jgi:hypothetical protein